MDIQSQPLTRMLSHIVKLHHYSVHLMMEHGEVYPGQPPLLLRLARQEGLSQNELAQQLRIKPATLTVALKRLEKHGVVLRKPDEKDQRISRVYLTDKGRQISQEVREALHQLEEVCFQDFSEEEKLQLRQFLNRIHDNLKDNEKKYSAPDSR
ncbi:MarR family winged helix-turn-helix transcriptional regulator [Marinicrinis lubricantis]|uniref:MarR family winged helix-turn-helix transcriptional regulator n=1 Tax=Marinicrinis lubricantis TaxID=2086470 RepID=A0ABW1ITW6_9BACL